MKTNPIPILILFVLLIFGHAESVRSESTEEAKRRQVIRNGLDWLAKKQVNGGWSSDNGQYPTAVTALAGNAMLAEGSTTTQGRYAKNISRTVTLLLDKKWQPNGLIGDPKVDDRYTYGHGFAMLFLSQVLGEEEDQDRRDKLVKCLTQAVKFTGEAQTKAGGWGYVSAKDGNDFDEGSTTITQVQGLRSCRNAGIPVPAEIINKAVKYIEECTGPDGGVYYSSKARGAGRPAITAAAVACLFNAGEYDDKYVPRLLDYCKKNIRGVQDSSGHWHYTHYYYAQVMYRQGGEDWAKYKKELDAHLMGQVGADGSWGSSGYGPAFSTAINLTILQLDNAVLPIYQR